MHKPVTRATLKQAVAELAQRDADLAGIVSKYGAPPLWERDQGFPTLIHIILEQQVSLVSADAMFRRVMAQIKPLTPAAVLAAGAPFLQSFGVTRQKAAYFINVAQAIHNGNLVLEVLAYESDESAIAKLTSIKGVGPWTAKIYLLMALCRPDVWPVGDIALATAVQKLKGLEKRPTQPELSQMALAWSPHRATAARMLWHFYLSGMQENIGDHR